MRSKYRLKQPIAIIQCYEAKVFKEKDGYTIYFYNSKEEGGDSKLKISMRAYADYKLLTENDEHILIPKKDTKYDDETRRI